MVVSFKLILFNIRYTMKNSLCTCIFTEVSMVTCMEMQ